MLIKVLAKFKVAILLSMPIAAMAGLCIPKELSMLENLEPIEQAKLAVSNGNNKLLGVYQFSLEVPAVSGSPYCWIDSGLVKVIQGTGDKICSEEHGRLQNIARNYALEYNKTILKLVVDYVKHKCSTT